MLSPGSCGPRVVHAGRVARTGDEHVVSEIALKSEGTGSKLVFRLIGQSPQDH